MPFTDTFWRALADYTITFPDLAALGSGATPATWLAEYTRVRGTAFASVLITTGSFEGGNSAGQRNFDQETRLDALHCRRFELDPTYTLPRHLTQFPNASTAANFADGGLTLRFEP